MKNIKLFILLFSLMQFPAEGMESAGIVIFPKEYILVQTDRDIYISGEQLFFRLSVLDSATHKLTETSNIAYLVLRDSASRHVADICMKLKNGIACGNIYLHDTLSSGPYQVVAFTNLMKNEGEAAYFTKTLFIANQFDKQFGVKTAAAKTGSDNFAEDLDENTQTGKPVLKIITDKKQYTRNEQIRMTVEFPTVSNSVSSSISISVHELTPYFQPEGKPRFKQTSVTADPNSVSYRYYLPETKGRILQGKIVEKQSSTAAKNYRVLLSAADSATNMQYADTDSSGCFHFLLGDYYTGKDLFIRNSTKLPGHESRIETQDQFELKSLFTASRITLDKSLQAYLKHSQDIVYVQKNYGLQPKVSELQQPAVNVQVPALYYQPHYRIFPSEYVPLPDFSEIARELLPTVRLRKQKEGITLTVTDLNHHQFFENAPAIFLNGVMIADINSILPMGSDMLERIEVVNSKVVYGSFMFENGILALFTKDKLTRDFYRDAMLFRTEPYVPFTGMEVPANLLQKTKSTPNFRQLLYWNPDLSLKGNQKHEIEFSASELTGTYIIKAEGIASTGEFLSTTTVFTVR